MRPLEVNGIKAAGTPEQLRGNILSALGRKLPEVTFGPLPHDGTLVVVGSGPSLADSLGEVKAEREKGRPIIAIKGAHDYLVGHGIVPTAFLSLEPRDRPVRLPQKACLYLLASRCPPELFDSLKHCRVNVFHTWDGTQPIPELKGKPLLTGGSTSGLRAISVGYAWGFRRFTLIGFDSCLRGNEKRVTGEICEPEKQMDVIVAGRKFMTNGAMALQAKDFRDMLTLMPDCTFDVRGDGLLAAINKEFHRLKEAA